MIFSFRVWYEKNWLYVKDAFLIGCTEKMHFNWLDRGRTKDMIRIFFSVQVRAHTSGFFHTPERIGERRVQNSFNP